jgi:cell shape-determining protein MreC
MRLNYGFLFMMAAALLASFLVPTQKLHGKIDALFTPIAYPVRTLAHGVYKNTTEPPKPPSVRNDTRDAEQLRDEIQTLKFQLAEKTRRVAELEQELSDFSSIKSVFDRCRIVKVTGGDAGDSQTLSLSTSVADTFVPDLPVIYPHGLAGRIKVINIGAARVQLVTDPAAKPIRCRFVRYKQDTSDFIPLPLPDKLVEGHGADGRMIIKQAKATELSSNDKKYKLAVGDWVVLDDKDWPTPVQGIKLGEVESINDQKNPLFVSVMVRPDADLMKLQEVMVMVKK